MHKDNKSILFNLNENKEGKIDGLHINILLHIHVT